MKKKTPTQKDVARFAGVSQAAVSRFVSGKGAISDEIREKILKVIDLVDYRPDPVARGLSSGRFNIIAIVMANITNPWYPVVLELITRELHRVGLQALLFNATPPQTVDDLMPLVLQYRVRGVIITTASLNSSGADLCVRQGVPVVMFNRYSQVGNGHSVSTDNIGGGRLAADVLHRSGSRRLGFLGGMPTVSTNRDRLAGFMQRVAELGLPSAPALEKEFTYAWGYEATRTLMARHPALDGLFCADDEIASGAIDALRYALGKRVPEDVRVFGFDDHPVASNAAYDMTTIRQPVEEMIAAAIALLLGDSTGNEHKLLPGQLIYRKSTPPA
ncbi:LacI family DNA-binding transcriptional regulator [Bordetella genomosp. 11]|uniref:LacI family transcriptional regulator n=1 Tax=Bordetella genomosp. 11 TaxID=1416808 RepID=A0A261UYI9_9BORD|nr:LacI family DNA-binding transcriptional regulator [Bordetella genomosp. 11]OZI66956.1 LacI family transcriptional regulator [Bordetella genomosp. 11]